jgi:hypothetical protein
VQRTENKQPATIQASASQLVNFGLQKRVEGTQRRSGEVLEFIENYDHSCPTQLTDGGGHGWEVDDRVGELSDVLEIRLTETTAKGRRDVPRLPSIRQKNQCPASTMRRSSASGSVRP